MTHELNNSNRKRTVELHERYGFSLWEDYTGLVQFVTFSLKVLLWSAGQEMPGCKGDKEDEIMARIDEAKRKAKTIEETCKSLPIFAYR